MLMYSALLGLMIPVFTNIWVIIFQRVNYQVRACLASNETKNYTAIKKIDSIAWLY